MKKLILMLSFILISYPATAAPTHFSDVVGSALLCKDQISSTYFNNYMTKNFGQSALASGGANWWKVSDKLFNSKLEYIFVGVNYDFIGATFADAPDKLIAKIKSATGMTYQQEGTGEWATPTYGVIINYNDSATPSKMFCVGSPYSPSIF